MNNATHIVRQALDKISADSIRDHIGAIEGPRHPVSAPLALSRAAGYIRDKLQSLGYEILEHRFRDGGNEFANIAASRRGISRPEERVIVLAHFDTVEGSPGADDNASGVAVMLELARVLSPLLFRRTIQFIGVNLEENGNGEGGDTGRRGSRALARYARENGWEIEGVIVLESVAFAGDDVIQRAPAGIPFEVPKVGDFIAVVGNEESQRLARGFSEAIDRYGLALPCQAMVVPGRGEALPDSRRSDHASFWDEGYRAIMVTDTTNFRSPHYHLPGDTLETLNLPFASLVCRAVGGLVAELAGIYGPD